MSASDSLNRQQFRTVYHGTDDPDVAAAIHREGLRPGTVNPHVYVSASRAEAQGYGDYVAHLRVPADMVQPPAEGDPRRSYPLDRVLQSGPIGPEHIVGWRKRRSGTRKYEPWTPGQQ